MNWPLILAMSLIGLVMGIASIFGLSGWFEYVIWIVIAGAAATALAFNVQEKIGAHAFAVGFLSLVLLSLCRFMFFSTYVENNETTVARPQLLAEAFMMSIAGGILLAIFGAVARRFIPATGDDQEDAPPMVGQQPKPPAPPRTNQPQQ